MSDVMKRFGMPVLAVGILAVAAVMRVFVFNLPRQLAEGC